MRHGLSLRWRIVLVIFALQLVLSAALLFFTLRQHLTSQEALWQRNDQNFVTLLSDLGRVALLTDDYTELQAFIAETASSGEFIDIVLVDLAGRVVAAKDQADLGSRLEPGPMIAGPDRWVVEVSAGEHRLGTLVVAVSDAALHASFGDAYRRGALVAGIGIVLMALSAFWFGHLLTHRLQRLAETADRITAGDSEARATIEGRDEIARVGRAVNAMLDRLTENLGALRLAHDRLTLPTEAMNDGFAIWDAQDRLVLCNRRFRHFFNDLDAESTDLTFFQALDEHTRPLLALDDQSFAVWRESRLACRRNGGTCRFDLKDGRHIEVSESRMQDGGTVGIYTDITETVRREAALNRSEARLRTIMASVGEAIVTCDLAGRIDSMNPAAERLFQRPLKTTRGRLMSSLFAPGSSDLDRSSDLDDHADGETFEAVGLRADGSRFPLEGTITKAVLDGSGYYVAAFGDLTRQKDAQAVILHQATHDPLTGLPNRALFNERLGEILKHAQRSGEIVAVAFLDIDRFKAINDSLGHAMGDALLVQLGERLRSAVREEDTIARMGGDEFIMILRGLRRVHDATIPARKIMGSLEAPMHIDGHELRVTASLGLSLYPIDAEDRDTLLRHADMALYWAKSQGRNTFRLFDGILHSDTAERVRLENDLRRAVDSAELDLVYQPQIEVRSGRVVGFEALMRWTHPERGPVPPDRFIGLAEDCGLIGQLGAFLLQRTAGDLDGWRSRAFQPGRLAINISPLQFRRGDLVDEVRRFLEGVELQAAQLELELTESALLEADRRTQRTIHGLHRLGVSLALDDFGTGFSSLSNLQRFPVQRVKIDRSFVRNMTRKPRDATLAKAIIGLAHGLGMKVVAEGVENEVQLDMLNAFGCDEWQGFLKSRPIAAAAVPTFSMADA
jgi:diguanylate cyclase (GGDEF)-like protein/PAS domain S-box-containing protein